MTYADAGGNVDIIFHSDGAGNIGIIYLRSSCNEHKHLTYNESSLASICTHAAACNQASDGVCTASSVITCQVSELKLSAGSHINDERG